MSFRRIGSGLKLTRKPSKTNLRNSVTKRRSSASEDARILIVKDEIETVTNPLSWLLNEISNNKITIMLFYRGQWCPICNQQIAEWNNLSTSVQNQGGQIYAICAQPEKYAVKLRDHHDLNFPLVADPDCHIAQFMGINIMEKGSRKFKKLVDFTASFVGVNTPAYEQITGEEEYKCGLSLPGVYAVDSAGDVVYSWKMTPLARNIWGSSERPKPENVWESVSHLLKRSQGEISEYYDRLMDDIPKAFDLVMQSPKAQEYFMNSLKKEFNAEALEFVQQAEKWKAEYPKKEHEALCNEAKELHTKYLARDAEKQLNLSSGAEGVIGDRLKVSNVDRELFDDVILEVLSGLRADSFPRFVIDPEFKDAMQHVDWKDFDEEEEGEAVKIA
eukprot:gb/GECH01012999.1/.p1 GENE.gb/GECH01012999.1/~~gb/GECH01012999.1/.p1  ORF type:complete len:388 (+),score=91.34 gb/GECH01012999.1/:1-1164(+)